MRLVVRIATLCLALLLLAVASLASAWNMGLSVSERGLSLPFAEDPDLVMGDLGTNLDAVLDTAPHNLAVSVRQAGRYDPLAGGYVLLAALESRRGQEYNDARILLQVARRREPRNPIIRALLVEAYLQAGNARGAAEEIAALDRLRRASEQELLPVLAVMLKDPAARPGTVAAIRSSNLRAPLMRTLARERVEPGILLALQDPPGNERLDAAEQGQVAGLILPYLEAGDIGAAIRVWSHYYDPALRRPAGVTDPAFSGYPGPPFGWERNSLGGGIAEFSGDGLQVTHFGRDGWIVVRQVMRLSPGRYRLSHDLQSGQDVLPNLAWRIDCLESGTTLLDLPFNASGLLGGAPRSDFRVPSDMCPAQWLALAARPDDAPSTRSIAVKSVAVVSLGGS